MSDVDLWNTPLLDVDKIGRILMLVWTMLALLTYRRGVLRTVLSVLPLLTGTVV